MQVLPFMRTVRGLRVASRDWFPGAGGLWRSDRGVAAIEAALIIPVMIAIIVATVELYQYFRAVSILDRAAFTLVDGVAMQRELYDAGPCDKSDHICTYGAIAQDLMTPLDFSSNGWIIIGVYAATEPSGGAPVSWKSAPEWSRRYAGSGTAGTPPDSQLDPASGFPPANVDDTLVVVEVFYDYVPFAMTSGFWETLGGTRRVYVRAFYRPRFADLRVLN